MQKLAFACTSILVLLLSACGKDNAYLVETNPNDGLEFLATIDSLTLFNGISHFSATLPSYLVGMGMTPPAINDEKATLGRVLFYDKNLSADNKISCASCHRQDKAFSDVTAFSTGVFGQQTLRNSSPLANTVNFQAHYQALGGLQPLLFWDHRAQSVPEQSTQTFENPLEMGMPMSGVLERVRNLNYYPYLWKQAYGHFEPTQDELLDALAEFVGAMSAHNSKFDRSMIQTAGTIPVNTDNKPIIILDTLIFHVYYGDTTLVVDTQIIILPFIVPGLDFAETRGLRTFVENCSNCHSPIRPFQDVFAACNGLDMDYADEGLGALTGNPKDMGVFKSPSLRNITLTAPYMHDGRFKTLDEVVEFYSSGVQPHPNLHPTVTRNLHLSPTEKADLIAFLHTLTDKSIAQDDAFSNPFRK